MTVQMLPITEPGSIRLHGGGGGGGEEGPGLTLLFPGRAPNGNRQQVLSLLCTWHRPKDSLCLISLNPHGGRCRHSTL